MKPALLICLLAFPLFVASAFNNESFVPENADPPIKNNPMSSKILIKVGDRTFTAPLFDNPSADAFKAMQPLTNAMNELNANEKFYRLSKNLPVNAANPGTIHEGDFMLWGANTVVLFNKSFPTAYSYTPLGKLDNHPTDLAPALEAGNVTVTFELQQFIC